MGSPGVVFIGSHLGYPMDRTPLGGGAMVGLHLARRWADSGRCRLALLGSGPDHPVPDDPKVVYARLGGQERGLVDLSELSYARFCRVFEAQTTLWLLSRTGVWRPESTVVVVNDISEGPDLAAIKRAGYPVVSIWHVDVVDYFNRLYLRGLVAPEAAAAVYERLRRAGLGGLVPDVLRLVFEKQRSTVERSDVMVLPSSAMRETISRCYASSTLARRSVAPRFLIKPWGVLDAVSTPEAQSVAALKKHYQIGAETVSILTLSRISPEKGLHLLLESLLSLERAADLPADVAVFICGAPAFMQGRSYYARLRSLAARFRKVRCFFPGYLASAEKPAFFALADLFVSPSVHESYGLTIVEAMSAGLPVLASDHYGVRDILDEASGLRVSGDTMTDALAALMRDRRRLGEMGKAAAARAAGMRFETASAAVLDAALGLVRAPVEAA